MNESNFVSAYLDYGGTWVPIESFKVEQTTYGIADNMEITTPLKGSPDYMAMSQATNPMPIALFVSVANTGFQRVFTGYAEDIEDDHETDLTTIKGRGLLANLVDARTSLKALMNVTVTQAITALITRYHLKSRVAASNTKVGTILKGDYVATGRNLKVLDFIHLLCRNEGWSTRVQGDVVIVGPPPDPTAIVLPKDWRKGVYLTGPRVTHNALHNRHIVVKVVSYHQGSKKRGRGRAKGQGPISRLLGFPAPLAGTAKPGQRAGRVSDTTTVGERENVEEYVIPVAGLTQDECIRAAELLRDEINRHEFLVDMAFSPSIDEFMLLVKNTPEFTVQITGVEHASAEGAYFPKNVTLAAHIGQEGGGAGLVCELNLVNHELPAPTGGV